ncbi:MOSC domain-containing protein [Shewanella sp. VB17]|uniref:MOSC domain-containing protein n=1 Tax=Shewanella sp. VB17 TaxID=2739432 RepID=UPI0015670440|nr:MOSC domain-containing protein [Shewanella sp. VB17]NRD71953.1 MOSC domain-containing protein [Shewanella sp. VB17]
MLKEVLVKQLSGLYAGDEVVSVEGISSGIDQKKIATKLNVSIDSVVGDAQADPKHHGGPDRVLHHFPREHYGQYRRWDMMNGFKDAPTMGENISTVGLEEAQVNIGDVIAIGDVELQVTQPRSPCFKLNHQFGHKEFALAMQVSGLCGWFYRVLKPGVIDVADNIVLLDRLSDISVRDAMNIYFSPEFDAKAYNKLAVCDGLAQSWVCSLQRRVESRKIESWEMRLFGPQK